MSINWHDMKPYYQGVNPDGLVEFSIPLPPDEDGMVGRECPNDVCQPRYFKIAYNAANDETVVPDSGSKIESLFCPYCSNQAGLQNFTTNDQLEWMKSMILRDMLKNLQDAISKGFKSAGKYAPRKGMFSMQLIYKPGRLPSVRHYLEKELKHIVECDQCSNKYAVYGIAPTCPFCGQGNLHKHLRRSVEIIKLLLEGRTKLEAKAGKDAGHHLVGNCLEDCVSLFEGFLKVVYFQSSSNQGNVAMRQSKLQSLGNALQNLSRAERIFRDEFGLQLYNFSEKDRDFLELQFAKRHLITHNLGLIDERFHNKVQSWQNMGQDIEISPLDVDRTLQLVEGVLLNVLGILDSSETKSG